ncbi:MAG: hypothetical protein Q4Q23_02125 [Methanobacteriaceae archaeon]|nr:hypothetical protein [Methanobacteriaceae archaeon]
MSSSHRMKVLIGIPPKQVNEIMEEYHLNMLETKKGLVFEGELEDLRAASNHFVDYLLPPGPTESEIQEAVDKYDVQLKQTEMGPTLQGTMYNINEAILYIIDVLEKRIDEEL